MGILKILQKSKIEKKKAETKRALKEAKNISKILVEKFGAKKVFLYGSLAREKNFDDLSDIDLAVVGLGNKYLKAYGHCIMESKFKLDIRAYEDMTDKFKNIISKEGLILYER
ncbi:MAG: nucleotidyltransferase family protein [Actinomycetota bacterium]